MTAVVLFTWRGGQLDISPIGWFLLFVLLGMKAVA